MNEKFEQIKEKAKKALESAKFTKDLAEIKAGFLGKTGEITGLLKLTKERLSVNLSTTLNRK